MNGAYQHEVTFLALSFAVVGTGVAAIAPVGALVRVSILDGIVQARDGHGT